MNRKLLTVPETSLVVLIGPSGSGKTTFGRTHFAPYEVVSSDFCRGLVGNDESDQSVSAEAFALSREIIARRLALGHLTVVDATNVRRDDRRDFVRIAREHHYLPVAIVFDLPLGVVLARNAARPDRDLHAGVVRRQRQEMRRSVRGLGREGFRYVHVLRSEDDVAGAEIERRPSFSDRRVDRGPFDVIGDVHGCIGELVELLERLGYQVRRQEGPDGVPGFEVGPPAGRTAIFLGDLVDRGPGVADVLALAMGMVESGTALALPGNHEVKLLRKLRGRNVRIAHGLKATLEQLEPLPEEFRSRVVRFLDGLVSHYVLDGGRLVVAHAGMKEEMAGRASGKVREFALYGDTTGETDEFGLPVRYDWARDYRGAASVVYGHTPVNEAEWVNRTICIDTGCVFGGKLTALRWPEREIVSVPARAVWCEPIRPLEPPEPTGFSAQQEADDSLDLADVTGRLRVKTRLARAVSVRAEHSAAALEVMSRFAVDPRWLVYLPPTMAPPQTTTREGLLEHPDEAFDEFEKAQVERVVCEEKHMGSRAVLVVARDAPAAARRFGVEDGRTGVVFSRTGRPFFREAEAEAELVGRVRAALEAAGLFEELESDWVVLDAELMPWSAKARDLLATQYAPVGAAAQHGLAAAVQILGEGRDPKSAELAARYRERMEAARAYVTAYRQYCWPVDGLEGVRLAPFHLMASEGRVHADRDHLWHMGIAERLGAVGDPLLMATAHRVVDLGDAASRERAVAWWEDLTGRGGEGMVVKPFDFTAKGPRGIVQPALKCRGREYLRIIYGPEYTAEEHLSRLRERGLSVKRSLARREFALGAEGLERFVRREPLRRVHECVFALLALESEPVDPRL